MLKRSAILLGAALFSLFTPALARASDLPKQAYISGVVGHAQEFSLSCEARSAADWAAYWGVSIDEADFLNRLPRSDNPNEGFVGDPNDTWGYIPPASYGVHAGPVARLLRQYGLDAHAGYNLSWVELQSDIAAGRPVIVWVIGSIWAGHATQIETEDGQTITVAHNEHTMILIGYSETNVQLVDALTGNTVTYALDNFLTSWGVLGNMAVVGEGSQEQVKPTEEAAAPQEPSSDYTVQPGDTLGKLAAHLSLSWVDLAAWNDISFPYTILPGQQLVFSAPAGEPQEPAPTQPPGSKTYTVQRGDHLAKIAKALNLDWTVLAELNDLTPPYLIFPGEVIKLPGAEDMQPQATEAAIEVPEFYTADQTESLFALAHYYGLDWIQVAGMNDLTFPYMLSPGETIRLR